MSFSAIGGLSLLNEHFWTPLVRPQPQTDLHPAFFRPLFLLVLGPFERLTGDVSAVKWPEGLQHLSLVDTLVSGTSLVHFCRFYAPGELSSRAAPAAK